MNELSNNPTSPDVKRRRSFFLPRFRIASLLWLMAAVTAFFVGRQSEDIAFRLRQMWPGSKPYQLVKNPDGSLSFAVKSPVKNVVFSGTGCNIRPVDPSTESERFPPVRFTPVRDGTTEIEVLELDGGRRQIVLEVKKVTIKSIKEYKLPAPSAASEVSKP